MSAYKEYSVAWIGENKKTVMLLMVVVFLEFGVKINRQSRNLL